MSTVVVGIDPGTGVKSPCGVVIFLPNTKKILYTANVTSRQRNQLKNLRYLPQQVYEHLNETIDFSHNPKEITIYIETFVMRGKGGQTLHRFIGAVISRFPIDTPVVEVANTKVKRLVTGDGDASKLAVGLGVLEFFKENESSAREINKLIDNQEWDILDAFAIAIAGIIDGN